MSAQKKSRSDLGLAAALHLEGELTIYRAAELKERIAAALAGAGPVEFDLSGITEMDSAGLQLLIVAKREAAQDDKDLRFSAHSPAVVEVLDLVNLVGQFGDPVVLAAR